MMSNNKKIEIALKKHGYKMTPQRRIVINAIVASSEHLTPAELHQKVRREHPGVGLVTVYRTLEILQELGLVCELHAGGNCRSFMAKRPVEHHHHLICSDCGKVVDFTDCHLDELERRLARNTKFKIEGHLLEFLGRCRECRAEAG